MRFLVRHRIYSIIVAEFERTGKPVPVKLLKDRLGLSSAYLSQELREPKKLGLVALVHMNDGTAGKAIKVLVKDENYMAPPDACAPDWIEDDDWKPAQIMSDAEISAAFGGSNENPGRAYQ